MTKIVLEVDTITKNGTITIDGNVMNGLREFIYFTNESEEGFLVELEQKEKGEQRWLTLK
jgi:hypothetical protein